MGYSQVHSSYDNRHSPSSACQDPLFFFQNDLEGNDLKILEAEGYKITLRALHLLRTRLGLTCRIYDPVNRQLQEEEAAKGLLEGIGKGTIQGYGRELLYSHIRGCGYNIPRFVCTTSKVDRFTNISHLFLVTVSLPSTTTMYVYPFLIY